MVLFMEPRGSKPSNTEQIKMVRLSNCGCLFFILGCPQITVTCSGYGNVIILTSTLWDPAVVLSFTLGESSDYHVATATMSCEEYGWGAAYPRRETIDNAFTCQGEFIYSIPHTWANSRAPRVT